MSMMSPKRKRTLVAAGFILVAVVLVVVLWYVLGGRRDGAPGSLPVEGRLPVVVSDSTPVTFPAINTWEAPLIPLERGCYASSETIYCQVTAGKTVKGEMQCSRSMLITENDLAVLRQLQSASETDLTTAWASIDRSVRESFSRSGGLSSWAIRVILATRQTESDHSPGILRMLTLASVGGKVASIPSHMKFEQLGQF